MQRVLKFITLFRLLFGKHDIDVKRIEGMGLLAVKIAQMYAVRSDLLGVEKCRQLQALYEQTTPVAWEVFHAVLQEHAPPCFWEEVQDIQEESLAAASLGQVHAARLRDGTEVVVKVLKPKALGDFEADLRAVRFLARLAVICYPKLKRLADPLGTIETIARLTRTELDLENEARGTARLESLRDAAEGLPHLANLRFPHIYTELSSSHVLVTERLMVKSVSKGLDDGSFSYGQLLSLFRLHGYFLFLRGEFHGDLHPGNVFFEGEQFWFIDNANIEETNPDFSRGLLQFLGQLGAEDYHGAAAVMEELSLAPPKDSERYYEKFIALYAGFKSGRSSLTNQMMETVKLCVHEGLAFPEGAFPVIKSLMYLDGMVLKCAPEAQLLEDVLEFVDHSN